MEEVANVPTPGTMQEEQDKVDELYSPTGSIKLTAPAHSLPIVTAQTRNTIAKRSSLPILPTTRKATKTQELLEKSIFHQLRAIQE